MKTHREILVHQATLLEGPRMEHERRRSATLPRNAVQWLRTQLTRADKLHLAFAGTWLGPSQGWAQRPEAALDQAVPVGLEASLD